MKAKSTVTVRTDDIPGFFKRAKDAARRADQGRPFTGKVTLSFEDPQRMFAVLSVARRTDGRSHARTQNDQSVIYALAT
ncbi:MAG: hypothetical protein ACKO4M_08540 [Betaproteobacteria bacterium]